MRSAKFASKIEKRIKVKKVEKSAPKQIYKESNSFTNPFYKAGESSTRQHKDKAPTLDAPKD